MTLETTRRVLNIAAVALIGAAAFAVVLASIPPGGLSTDSLEMTGTRILRPSAESSPSALSGIADDEVWSRPLRQGFRRPRSSGADPPVVRQAPRAAAKRPQARPASATSGPWLVGTVVEGERGTAILAEPDGTLQFRNVGDRLVHGDQTYDVLRVLDRKVHLASGDNEVTLNLGQSLMRSGGQANVSEPTTSPSPTDDRPSEASPPNTETNSGSEGDDGVLSIEDELDMLNGDF